MISKINPVFYQEFRSITLLLESRENEGKLSIPLNVITNWLSRYDSWWTKVTGINRGKNLHLLYGRYLTCTGPRLLRFTRELLDIALFSSRMGYIYSLKVDLYESVEQRKLFNQLMNSGHVDVISIEVNTMKKKHEFSKYLSLIEAIIKKGISLNLLGPVNFWKKVGILDSPILNSSCFRIIPPMSKKIEYLNYQRRSTFNEPTISNRNRKGKYFIYSFNPCSERFQIYISPFGDLYPCKGLIGIPSCKIGTIYDNIESTVFGGGKDNILDFRNLAKNGPKLEFDETISDYQGLPPICFFHRNSILEK